MSDQSQPREWVVYRKENGEEWLTTEEAYQEDLFGHHRYTKLVEKSAFDAQAQELASLRAENEKLNAIIDKHGFAGCESEIDSLKSKLEAAEKEIQQLKSKHAQHVADLEGNSKATYKHNNQLVKECVELREEIEAANDVVKDLADMMNKAIAERNELKALLSNANSEQNRASVLEQENLSLKAELKDMTINYEGALSDYDDMKEQCNELKAENEKYRAEMDKITNGIPSEWAYAILRKERDELKAKLEAAEKEIERLKSQMSEADLRDLQAGEFYVVYHKNHPDPAEAFVAKFKEFETLNNRYRTALDVAVTELRRLNMDAPIELTIHTGQVLVGITEIIASAPEAGPTKDELLDLLFYVKLGWQQLSSWPNLAKKIDAALEAAKGK